MTTEPIKRFSQDAILALLFAGATAVALILAFSTKQIITLAIAAAFVLTVGVILSGNPRLFCLWGLLLAAPSILGKGFAEVNPHMGGVASYRIELVDVFLLPMLAFLLRDLIRGYREKLRLSKVVLFWGLLIMLGGITVMRGPFRTLAGQQSIQMTKELILFLVVLNEVVRVKQFRHVLLALMCGVLLQCIIALIQYVFTAHLGLERFGEQAWETVQQTSQGTLKSRQWVYRVGALIGHANLLAAYLALLLPMGIAILFTRIDLRYKVVCGIAVLLGMVVLILTQSRSGWISFAAAFTGLMVLTFLHPQIRRRYILARAAMMGAVIILLAAFSGPIASRIFTSDPGAYRVRLEFLETAWNMVKAKPVLGFGLNSYVFSQAPYTKYGSDAAMHRHFGNLRPIVHNIYAIIWAEQGTLGIIAFLLLHGYIILIGYRNLRVRHEVLFAMNIGALCGVVAIMVDGSASFFMRLEQCARVFWIVVAIIVAIHYWHRENSVSPVSSKAT